LHSKTIVLVAAPLVHLCHILHVCFDVKTMLPVTIRVV